MKHLTLAWMTAVALSAFLLFAGGATAQSLFKTYTEMSKEDLSAQTEEMSGQIVRHFDQRSMEATQQKIYFYEYFSNLKRLVLYGIKLANYSEYEEKLIFAKENELFKGLPEKAPASDEDSDTASSRTRFVSEKYVRMKTNIRDEIDSYTDLIQSSLDACEHLARYDLDMAGMSPRNKERIRYYFQTDTTYQQFLAAQPELARSWPGLAAKIQSQLRLWQEKPKSPEDPVIDIKIT